MTPPDQPPTPSVSTAPAEGASASTASPSAPLGRRRVPGHLGPARTSTVMLAVAFVAIGVLYLFVKPPEPSEAASTGSDPATTSRTGEATTPAPAPTTPTTTAARTSETPTSTEATTTPGTTPPPTDETTETSVEPTTEPTAPEETDEQTSEEPLPTTTAPPS